jgi:rRNA maturation RNase YbeY
MREGSGPETPLLGDVVVSVDTAERQAKAGGWSLDEELVRLLTHGVLHLLGFDHEQGRAEASRMRRKEHAVLRSLGRLPKLVAPRK